jgi:hypothetical protein
MTETPAPGAMHEIAFKGRSMWVKMPTPEQLLVWQRTIKLLQGPDVDGWGADQVMRALERTRKIIDSVLVDAADRDWLDDEMLDNGLTLIDTADIIRLTVEAFGTKTEDGKPVKAAPRKRATRRKATT